MREVKCVRRCARICEDVRRCATPYQYHYSAHRCYSNEAGRRFLLDCKYQRPESRCLFTEHEERFHLEIQDGRERIKQKSKNHKTKKETN